MSTCAVLFIEHSNSIFNIGIYRLNCWFVGTKAHCEAKQDELELSDEDTEVTETADEDNATNMHNDTMDEQDVMEDDVMFNDVANGIEENPAEYCLVNDTGDEAINNMVDHVLNNVMDTVVTNMPNADVGDKRKGEQGKGRKRKLLKVTLINVLRCKINYLAAISCFIAS